LLKVIRALLPKGEAFKGGRNFTRVLQSIAQTAQDIKLQAQLGFAEFDPYATTRLGEWVAQFGIWPGGSRDQLAAAWRATGGQSKTYLQEVLQAQGFPVYVHEWWAGSPPPIGSIACAAPRDPRTYLTTSGQVGVFMQAGEPLAQAGEPQAQAGETLGAGGGYLLVDRQRLTVIDYTTQAGEPLMQAGELLAQAGEGNGAREVRTSYLPPADPLCWPFFCYIGGATFPAVVKLPLARRDEFETLLLKYAPGHVWLGVLVNYE
jgi:hypothetical protein